MNVTYIYACRCGAETPCESEDLRIGRVYQCPVCKSVGARVQGANGTAWITVDPAQVEFYGLLEAWS